MSKAAKECQNTDLKKCKEWAIATIKTQHAESLEARAVHANVKEETKKQPDYDKKFEEDEKKEEKKDEKKKSLI